MNEYEVELMKCKTDPLYFAKYVLGIKLYGYQEDLITKFMKIGTLKSSYHKPYMRNRNSGKYFINNFLKNIDTFFKFNEKEIIND